MPGKRARREFEAPACVKRRSGSPRRARSRSFRARALDLLSDLAMCTSTVRVWIARRCCIPQTSSSSVRRLTMRRARARRERQRGPSRALSGISARSHAASRAPVSTRQAPKAKGSGAGSKIARERGAAPRSAPSARRARTVWSRSRPPPRGILTELFFAPRAVSMRIAGSELGAELAAHVEAAERRQASRRAAPRIALGKRSDETLFPEATPVGA